MLIFFIQKASKTTLKNDFCFYFSKKTVQKYNFSFKFPTF